MISFISKDSQSIGGIFMQARQRVPLGVILIAGFYAFGACVLLVCMFTNPGEVSRQVATVQGLPTTIDLPILPLTTVLALLIAYGLFSLSTWGFYLTLLYALYVGSINLFLAGKQGLQPYLGNFLWSLIVIIYLLARHKIFFSGKTLKDE